MQLSQKPCVNNATIYIQHRKTMDPYENCIHCGACVNRCPAGAITLENLRNLKECRTYAGSLRKENNPGNCGKCLVGIPCEYVKP